MYKVGQNIVQKVCDPTTRRPNDPHIDASGGATADLWFQLKLGILSNESVYDNRCELNSKRSNDGMMNMMYRVMGEETSPDFFLLGNWSQTNANYLLGATTRHAHNKM